MKRKKLCDKCRKRKRVGEWRYCATCLSWVRRAMERDGYLAPQPKHWRRDTQ